MRRAERAQDQGSGHLEGLFLKPQESELGGPVNGLEHIDLARSRAQLGDIPSADLPC